MRWSKIKNIILLLLLAVNAILLSQVSLREWRSRRGEQETREWMIDILARNDVAYLPETVPGALGLLSRRVTPAPFGEAEAAVLAGTVTGTQTLGGRRVYTGTEGTVTVTAAGELAVEYTPSETLSESVLLDRLSELGIALRETARTYDGDDLTVTYVQLWRGVPIPRETAVLTYVTRSPCTLTLRFLTGEEEIFPAEETVTAVTALARFLDELSRGEGYVCSQITDMYPGYGVSGNTPVTLTPAWFIETDSWRFMVDGRTGQVTAME